ncbi:MAG: SpoIIE family protein phosphatase [Oscillospiraceae bacterium]|nr:SpoIIE family protein phosphatase [Oscillospiraceae bacterium]
MRGAIQNAVKKIPGQRIQSWLRFGGSFLASALACGIRLPGGLSPFGPALTLALPGDHTLAAFAGSMIGYCCFGGFEENLARITALLCALGVKLLVMDRPKLRACPVMAVAAALLTGGCMTARNILLELGSIDLLFSVAEGVLSGTLCYFSWHGGRALLGERKLSEAGAIARMSLALLGMTVLTGLCQLSLPPLNAGRILFCAILPVVGRRRGTYAAVSAGICCTAAMMLSDPALTSSGAVCAAAGFWSAHFAASGRVRHGLLYLLIGLSGLLLSRGGDAALQASLDLISGTALYLLLPERVMALIPRPEERPGRLLFDNSRVAARLRFSSETLEDIRSAVEAVSKKLYASGVCSMESVYDSTADRVCRKCGLKMFCWETAYSQTMEAFSRLTPALKEKGFAEQEDMPGYFTGKCPKAAELLRSVNAYYQEYISREAASRKVMEAKQVASEQLGGVSDLLLALGEEFSDLRRMDRSAAERAKELLIELGEDPAEVWCPIDRFDRMRVEVCQERPMKLDGALAARHLSRLLERPFAPPSAVTAGGETRIIFCEKARYTVEIGTAQLNAADNRICGDCCDHFTDGRGYFHLVLSDGMGSGGRAAVDSIMTCSFVMKLIKAGFGFDAALKLLNSALLCKAGDETLATLDIGCIDLYTGKTELLKAGAAPSFLCRDGKCMQIGGQSLPVGILQGIEYDRHTVRLRQGDMLVMVTDGAMAVSESWMREEITLCADASPEAAAKRVASAARHQNGLPGDDITVAVLRILPAE